MRAKESDPKMAVPDFHMSVFGWVEKSIPQESECGGCPAPHLIYEVDGEAHKMHVRVCSGFGDSKALLMLCNRL